MQIFKIFTTRPDLIKRIIYLAVITLFLAIIRFSAMNFEFPTFTMDENPIAKHPLIFVRVSVMPNRFRVFQTTFEMTKLLFVFGYYFFFHRRSPIRTFIFSISGYLFVLIGCVSIGHIIQ